MEIQWVYIYTDRDGNPIVGTTGNGGRLVFSRLFRQRKICYLRPFDQAFDALAHKCLLDTLSLNSIKHLINAEKARTELWLSQLKDTYTTIQSTNNKAL